MSAIRSLNKKSPTLTDHLESQELVVRDSTTRPESEAEEVAEAVETL